MWSSFHWDVRAAHGSCSQHSCNYIVHKSIALSSLFFQTAMTARYTMVPNWLVVWNMFYFPIYWECHHPNWRTHIFQRAGPTTSKFQTHVLLGCSVYFFGAFVFVSGWLFGGSSGFSAWQQPFLQMRHMRQWLITTRKTWAPSQVGETDPLVYYSSGHVLLITDYKWDCAVHEWAHIMYL